MNRTNITILTIHDKGEEEIYLKVSDWPPLPTSGSLFEGFFPSSQTFPLTYRTGFLEA